MPLTLRNVPSHSHLSAWAGAVDDVALVGVGNVQFLCSPGEAQRAVPNTHLGPIWQ